MQKAILVWLLIPAVALALAACGSGGGDAQTGVTAAAGSFKFEKGGTVQSKMGNVALDRALASSLMTPVDLVPKTLALTGTPDTTPPPAPSLISPQNGDTWGGHVVKFQWTPVTDPSGVTYHLVVSEMGGTGPIYDIADLTSTSIDLMLFDDNYEWYCEAIDGAGNSSTPMTTPPTPPTTWYFQVLNSDTAPPDCAVLWPTGADTGPPDVAVTYPIGGETLTGGSDVTITWTGADDLTPSSQLSMGVYYSLDNGGSWSTITRTLTNSGSTVWSVPNVNSDQCLIRVLGRDRELKVGVDTSDSVFSIVADSSKSLETVSKDSDGGKSQINSSNYIRGESLIGGQYYSITWYSLDDLTPTYDLKIVLFFSSDGGSNWSEITSLSNNYGAYYWQAPNLTSNKCLIKLYAIDSNSKTGVAVSASVFTITQSSSAAWPSSTGSQISTVASPSNTTLASSNSTVTEITESSCPTGGPADFTGGRTVSFRATGVTDTANITLTFPTLPINPVFYKVVNGVWKQLYPTNEWTGISNVALTGNALSYTIADNSDADADPAVGVVADPVVVGQLAAAVVTGDGGSGAVNTPPPNPVLVSPTDGQTGLATSVLFTWNKLLDPDGDTVSYQVVSCTNQDFSGCTPIDVPASASTVQKADLGALGAGIILIGFITGSGSRRTRKSLLVIPVLLLVGGLFTACGGGSSSTPAPNTELTGIETVSLTVSGLTPTTKYFWKVIASDGKGGLSTSETRSFTTQ